VVIARTIAVRIARWPFAVLACALLAAALLLPGLGNPGLWEPHERQLSDRLTPPRRSPGTPAAVAPPAVPAPARKDACLHAPPQDATARTLSSRAIQWGRDALGDSDRGRRLPLALLGVLTVLAAAGIAIRLAGGRAGIVTAIVLLAMPLLTLQARMLTSEIGTACGGALIVYGLVALGELRRGRAIGWATLDAALAIAAIAAGGWLGFSAGGALLGWLVPLGAVAAAASFGAPLRAAIRDKASIAPALVGLAATLGAVAVAALLAHQLFDLKPVYPGLTPPPARELLGTAITPSGCYAWALGGTWRAQDDLRMVFDSSFEQIAYGSFPWGLIAPIAMAALLASRDASKRRLGAIALAWAAAAWVAGEVFQRKVGFAVYAGFPALAIAVGGWLDAMFAGRARGEPDAMPPGARLIGLFAVLGALALGKDIQSFSERLTSLLVGNDGVLYPTQARLAWLPTKAWVLILGAVIAIGFAVAVSVWRAGGSPRDRWCQRVATRGAITALGATLALATFWTSVWQPRLALHLSSKAMFETYEDLARPGDELVVLGDLGQAPFAYTRRPPQTVADRAQLIAALGRPNRVFAIAPQTELCSLHREVAGKPYYVLDDRNQRSVLLSNRVDGSTDKNPLRTAIVHDEPTGIMVRPKGKVVWDGRIQLLGWALPKAVARGARFDVTVYYKILQPVGGAWKALMHVDGPPGRAGNGDHEPINGRCPTSTWQPGDYIIDRFTTRAGGGAFPAGTYDVWLGFFTGSNPNWRNMPVSEAPGDMRDATDRVKITTLVLE
jgi:hypothetical protein